MRVMLRADAGVTQGTGHVMRLLTLSEALHEAGHEAVLASAEIDIPWLADAVAASGMTVVDAGRDRLDLDLVSRVRPDWVVVDSYQIRPAEISDAAAVTPLLLMADGLTRGARATVFLDQNLGAEDRPLPDAGDGEQLRGSRYALVRSAFTGRVPAAPERLRHDPPHVVVVLGGTDADDRTLEIARACTRMGVSARFTFVAQTRQHDAIRALAGSAVWRVLPPTPELPALLAAADAVISAAGTTAWDVCTLGIPALLLAVVDNQRESLRAAKGAGVAGGADLVDAELDAEWFDDALGSLLNDGELRADLVGACREHFDGQGARRVTAALADRVPT